MGDSDDAALKQAWAEKSALEEMYARAMLQERIRSEELRSGAPVNRQQRRREAALNRRNRP